MKIIDSFIEPYQLALITDEDNYSYATVKINNKIIYLLTDDYVIVKRNYANTNFDVLLILGNKNIIENENILNIKFQPYIDYEKHKIDFFAKLFVENMDLLYQDNKINNFILNKARRLIKLQVLK